MDQITGILSRLADAVGGIQNLVALVVGIVVVLFIVRFLRRLFTGREAGPAQERGVKRIVKSKSMATEEIHLNEHLEKAGIEVRETDLGEWIIQLAGQRPSHMVMPAIHMTKEEVAEVFSENVEQGQQPDIPKLVKFARAQTRPKFLNADMGIRFETV